MTGRTGHRHTTNQPYATHRDKLTLGLLVAVLPHCRLRWSAFCGAPVSRFAARADAAVAGVYAARAAIERIFFGYGGGVSMAAAHIGYVWRLRDRSNMARGAAGAEFR